MLFLCLLICIIKLGCWTSMSWSFLLVKVKLCLEDGNFFFFLFLFFGSTGVITLNHRHIKFKVLHLQDSIFAGFFAL